MKPSELAEVARLASLIRHYFPATLPVNVNPAFRRNKLLNFERPWNELEILQESNSYMAEEFDLLDMPGKCYYCPYYFLNALEEPYYKLHLIDAMLVPQNLSIINQWDARQKETIIGIVNFWRNKIAVLKGFERWLTEIKVRDLDKLRSLLALAE